MRYLIAVVAGLLSCSPAAVPNLGHGAIPPTLPAAVAPAGNQMVPELPVHLSIPTLRVDSPIVTVGLMPDGSVGTPCDPTKPRRPCNVNATAWYDGSARPGAAGNAVIDGHVNWYGPAGSNHDVPGVFAQLNRLRLGDQVIVRDKAGINRFFEVDAITTLPYPKQPPGTYDLAGRPGLTLITCAGVYVSASTGTNRRLYVHAIQVGAIA